MPIRQTHSIEFMSLAIDVFERSHFPGKWAIATL